MSKFVVLVVSLVAVMLSGCQAPKKVVPMAEPVAPATLESIRQDYQKIDPNVRVGRVEAVREDTSYVAVEGIDVAGIKLGTIVTVVGVTGSTHSPVAHGEVTVIDGSILDVHYSAAQGAARPPAKGDLAVVFVRN